MAKQINQDFPEYTGQDLDRADGDTLFNIAIKYLLSYFTSFIPIINTWKTEANELAVEINNNAIIAEGSANNQGVWEADFPNATGTGYDKGMNVILNDKPYTSLVDNNTASPTTGTTDTNWFFNYQNYDSKRDITDSYSKIETNALLRGQKNNLVNGNLDEWTRTDATFVSGYTADQLFIKSGVSSVEANTGGSPTGSKNNALISRGVDGVVSMGWRIESNKALHLVGESQALRFYFATVSGVVSNITAELSYATVTDDFTASTLIQSISIANSPSGGFFDAIFDALPSTSVAGLELVLKYTVVGSTSFRLAQASMVDGTVNNGDITDYAQNKQDCRRYLKPIRGGLSGNANGTTVIDCAIEYNVPMRAIPTISNGSLIMKAYGTGASYTQSAVGSSLPTLSTKDGGSIRFSNFTGLTTSAYYNVVTSVSDSDEYACLLTAELF